MSDPYRRSCAPNVFLVQLTIPGRAYMSSPTRVGQYRDDSTTVANKFVVRDPFDLDAFRRWWGVVKNCMIRVEFGRKGVGDVRGRTGRNMLGRF